MKRIQLGSLDRRALFIDLSLSLIWQRYDQNSAEGFRVDWLAFLKPRNWFKVLTHKYYWTFRFTNHAGSNNRCYCDGGRSASITIELAGFYFRAWYSRFDGEVPCPCDQLLDAMDEDELPESGS